MADKKHYVYSTLASAVEYPTYTQGGGDLPTISSSVVIQGGANIPDQYMRTPEGAVVTPVTAEELEALERNPTFRLHKDNGFIKVSDKKVDGEKAASDMQGRDQSAPLVDQDFKEDQQPVTGKADAPKPNQSGRRA